jgi:hypothetical protein
MKRGYIKNFQDWKFNKLQESRIQLDADSTRAWMILENYRWSPLGNSNVPTLGELYMMGKKSDLLESLIIKESKLNESVNMILEDQELLEAFKMQIVFDFINEGFGSFVNKLARNVFGDDLVNKVEKAWGDLGNKISDIGKKILDSGKEIWDKTVTSLKSLVKNIASVAKKIGETIKNVLGTIWGGLTSTAGKIGKTLMGKSASDLNGLGKVLSGDTSEAEDTKSGLGAVKEAAKKGSFKAETSTLGEDFTLVRKKYFGGDQAPGSTETIKKIEDSGSELIAGEKAADSELKDSYNIQLSIDDVVLESLKGICTLVSVEELEKINNYEEHDFVSEAKLILEEEGGHHEKSAVVGWLTEIVKWVLSPMGNLIELLSGSVAKLACMVPSAIAKGWEGRSKFVILPTIAAFTAGLAYKISGIAHHFTEPHGESYLYEAENEDVADSVGDDTMKKLEKLTIGGLVGLCAFLILKAMPTLAFVFKCVMTALLVGMVLGFLEEAFPKTFSFMPDFFKKFYHAMH